MTNRRRPVALFTLSQQTFQRLDQLRSFYNVGSKSRVIDHLAEDMLKSIERARRRGGYG